MVARAATTAAAVAIVQVDEKAGGIRPCSHV